MGAGSGRIRRVYFPAARAGERGFSALVTCKHPCCVISGACCDCCARPGTSDVGCAVYDECIAIARGAGTSASNPLDLGGHPATQDGRKDLDDA